MQYKRSLPVFLLLPAAVLLGILAYPFIRGIGWSMQSFTNSGGTPTFNWGQNFVLLFTREEGVHALWITILYTLIVCSIELVVGIGIALLLNRDDRTTSVFRVLIVIPLLLPPVIGALMWRVMMAGSGVLNYFLELLGLEPSLWMAGPETALLSVALVDIWSFTPFVVLLMMAGLKSVPRELVEASAIDGAGAIRHFFDITLPLIMPVVAVTMLFRVADSLNMFDIIYPMTKGGPGDATTTLHVLGYISGIRNGDFGMAMAALVVLWVISMLVSRLLLAARTRAATNL